MKTMNILCATDKNFLNPAYVTINSIIINHPNININFYILLNPDVDSSDRKKLKAFVESMGHHCVFYDVDEDAFQGYVICEKFPKSAYYRLLAHTFLPKTVDRILYLDVDIVVNKNIYEDLYNIDFEDNYLVVASHNPNPDYFNKLDHSLVNIESAARGEFFNSGVLLMNIQKFRKDKITIQDYDNGYRYCEERDIPVFYDQGLLNFMFFDSSIYLSSMDYNYRYSIEKDYQKRLDLDREYKKAIIHYTGMKQPYKPWDLRLTKEEIENFGDIPYSDNYFYFSPELNDLCEIWWFYAESTPVFNEIEHDTAVKNKWFRRNLLDFVKKHNDMAVQFTKLNNTPRNPINNAGQPQIRYRYPEGFKHRTYKIALAITKPFFAFRELFRKAKK